MAHAFDNPNAPLSEGGALAVVVKSLPGKPDWTRVGNGLPASAATSVAGRRPACPRLAPRVAREGCWWRERPPFFDRWCGTGEG